MNCTRTDGFGEGRHRAAEQQVIDVTQPEGTSFRRGRAALKLLLEAYDCAAELRCSPWDFAVEIEELRGTGCTVSEIRWLVCRGFVRQGHEIGPVYRGKRGFQPCDGLVFDDTTCFTLTEVGVARARSLIEQSGQSVEPGPPSDSPYTPNRRLVPTWDRDRQELRLGNVVVKRYKVPAVNQERILAAFEEEEWPVRIDDPLPPDPRQPPKRRLHDTINSLNRSQKNPLIRFQGDGRGEGVRWNLTEANGHGAANRDGDGNQKG